MCQQNTILSLEAKVNEEIKINNTIDIVTIQSCQGRGKNVCIIELVLKQIIVTRPYFT